MRCHQQPHSAGSERMSATQSSISGGTLQAQGRSAVGSRAEAWHCRLPCPWLCRAQRGPYRAPSQPQRAAQPSATRQAAQPQPARPARPVSGGEPDRAFTDEDALEDDLLIVEDGEEGPGQPRPASQAKSDICNMQAPSVQISGVCPAVRLRLLCTCHGDWTSQP